MGVYRRMGMGVCAVLLGWLSSPAFGARCQVQVETRGDRVASARLLTYDLAPGHAARELNLGGVNIVSSTSGPCTFTFYHERDLRGEYQVYGTNLKRAVYIGRNGLTANSITGFSGTWPARSLVVRAVSDTNCKIQVGAGGSSMDYYSSVDRIPAVSNIYETPRQGTPHCAFDLYEAANFSSRLRQVQLGQNLSYPIGAGADGIYWRGEGAVVWSARSIRVRQIYSPDKCLAKVGARRAFTTSSFSPPITMEYPSGQYYNVPKHNTVHSVKGYDCAVRLYSNPDFNRRVSGENRKIGYYEDDFGRTLNVGFDVQSLAVFPD
ncbi:MAG: hypothetical protein R3B54_00825 [Bdellovibrionota bacterium]